MNIDEWTAEQCGVKIEPSIILGEWQRIDDWTPWTIQDPRCREIVREHFKICTDFSIDGWFSGRAGTTEQYAGKTIAEAEIACIKAIYKTCQGDL